MPAADHQSVLLEMFRAAVASADPAVITARHLPDKPRGRCIVVGAGKASAAMALAVEQAWPDVDLSGTVATRYGHGAPCRRIRIIEAGHPVPDAASMAGASEMIRLLGTAGPDDLVLALISGGGSATLALPLDGVTLADKQALTAALLRSGAPIAAINRVRKALSQVKGGRLAHHAGAARVHSLIISDIPGDDPADVASGPTVPGENTGAAVLDILSQYKLAVPPAIHGVLARQHALAVPPRPQDRWDIIASPALALAAAATIAQAHGFAVKNLGDRIEGEAAAVARNMARQAIALAGAAKKGQPLALISGGETTVTLPDDCDASGGRNTEFQLALALALNGHGRIWALAGDSDGIDGTSTAAGAIVSPDTLQRASAMGLDPAALLAAHRSCDFFARLGDLVTTGPTLTNVNDIRIQLIG